MLYDMVKDLRSERAEIDKELKVLSDRDSKASIQCAVHDRDSRQLFAEMCVIKDDVGGIKTDVEKIKFEMISISHTLRDNTESLREHIAGVNTLKELHLQNANRIEKLEQPSKAMEFIKGKIFLYTSIITAIAGAITAIVKFL
jgi:hypothetical protein